MHPMSRKILMTLFAITLMGVSLKGAGQDVVKSVYDSAYMASVQDSIDRYYKRHPWKLPRKSTFKTIPYFSVFYTQEYGFGAIGGFIGTYNNSAKRKDIGSATNRATNSATNSSTNSTKTSADSLFYFPQSAISVTAGISTKLFVFGAVTGLHYSPGGNFLIDYTLKYRYLPRYFWGLGYENGDDNGNKSSFKEQSLGFRTELLYRSVNGIRAGGIVGYDYFLSGDFSSPELIGNLPLSNSAISLGGRFEYDTRDNISSPEHGMYIDLEQLFFIGLSNNAPYYRTKITADFYFPLWEGGVAAIDLFGEFNYGDSPWMMWAQMGGEERMRGYYHGKYRDRNLISAQLELRQHIYKGHGAALWTGAGNIFHDFTQFNIANTLPTLGLGYRFTFFGLILRADVGFGKAGQISFFAGVNQAF